MKPHSFTTVTSTTMLYRVTVIGPLTHQTIERLCIHSKRNDINIIRNFSDVMPYLRHIVVMLYCSLV